MVPCDDPLWSGDDFLWWRHRSPLGPILLCEGTFPVEGRAEMMYSTLTYSWERAMVLSFQW